MLICRHCGWENPDEAAFCTNCGRGLIRGRVVQSPDTAVGGRFRALGSPVVTVQASDPPPAVDPPMPRLRAPAQAASTPTLLDFRMPEQMLAELSRMRRKPPSERARRDDSTQPDDGIPRTQPDVVQPGSKAGNAGDRGVDGAKADATTPIRPHSSAPASQAPPRRDVVSAPQMATSARGNLGDIARALRAEDPPKAVSPAETAELVSQAPRTVAQTQGSVSNAPADDNVARPAVETPELEASESPKASGAAPPLVEGGLHVDPPTIDPGEMLPDEPSHAPLPLLPAEESPEQGEVHLLTQRRVTTKPPPGLYVDPPMEELPFFESSDDFSNPPAPVSLGDPEDDPDLPFVLGPELEIRPSIADAEPPGASVDLLPPDGSVDFESGEFDHDLEAGEFDADAFELDAQARDALESAPGERGILEVEAVASGADPGETLQGAPKIGVADVPHEEESEEFAAVIARVDAAAGADAIEPDAEALDDGDVVIEDVEDVEDEGLLDSGDMEAIILTTQTEQSIVRAAPPPMPAAASARFVLRPLSENLDESFVVGVGEEPIDIGRLAGDICFEGDAYLSPLHARFEIVDDALMVTDLDSVNGVWLRVRGEAEIDAGDVFLCGQQVIRLDVRRKTPTAGPLDGTARVGAASSGTGLALAVLDVDAEIATQYRVPIAGCRLGRQIADVVFTDDAFMSGTHALVQPRGTSALLRDLDSRNGVWVRLTGAQALSIGDAVMLGRTVLRVGQPSG